MHGLGNLSQNVRFVKILSFCVSLCVPLFHREMTLRTPRELPDIVQTEKVLFVNICHRHWLFSARRFPREFPSGHSGTSGIAVPLPIGCPALRGPQNATSVMGCTLRFRPREFPRLYTLHFTPSTKKIAPKAIFICIYAKKSVSLHPQFHAGDVCASSAGVADILKRRLLTLCSGELKLRNFQIVFRT